MHAGNAADAPGNVPATSATKFDTACKMVKSMYLQTAPASAGLVELSTRPPPHTHAHAHAHTHTETHTHTRTHAHTNLVRTSSHYKTCALESPLLQLSSLVWVFGL